MKKILVLCSGGFDSVVLVNYLIDQTTEEDEINLLFFNYGQLNYEKEKEAVNKLINKYNFLNLLEIRLPKFHWSNSKTDYLEMRNLVFLSYASSVSESLGISEIYTAFLKHEGNYFDTSLEFIENYNRLLEGKFKLISPFIKYYKEDLSYLARAYRITREDFFSCKHTIPCGKCPDCLAIDNVFKVVDNNTAMKEYLYHFEFTDRFKSLYKEKNIEEVRFLLNNDCQFKCTHCFYGFKEMAEEKMNKDEFKKAIRLFNEIGVNNIHFSGKEPFYNKDIFYYCEYIKSNYPNMTYDVVTNGLNVLNFKEDIKKSGLSKIYLSVYSLKDLGVRDINSHLLDTIKYLIDEIPLQIFIDVDSKNYKEVHDICSVLRSYWVKSFHIRAITPHGSGSNLYSIISLEQYNEVYRTLRYSKELSGATIEVSLLKPWVDSLLDSETSYDLKKDLFEVIDSGNQYFNDSYSYPTMYLSPEFYCSRFSDQITMTPDGFLLGCAIDLCDKEYENISAGNIKRINNKEDLVSYIDRGKEYMLEFIKKEKYSCFNKNYGIK